MAKNNKKSEIDEIVNEYFQILEEDLGLSYIYQDLPDNEVNNSKIWNKPCQCNGKLWFKDNNYFNDGRCSEWLTF